MIETHEDLQRFHRENLEGDWIVHIVPTDGEVHAVASKPSLLFIRNLSTSKTYGFSFCHPDSIPTISQQDILAELSIHKNQKWALDKKIVDQLLPLENVLDANLAGYMMDNSIIELAEYETPAHGLIRRNSHGHNRLNQAIPMVKHLETFDGMADDLTKMLKHFTVDTAFTRFNSLIIETLGRLESEGIYVDKDLFHKHFDVECDGMVYSQYNVYTATGRPSNRYGGVNYAALNQSDGSRRCFRSRYGNDGRIVVIDYTAFHPRIISTLTKYPIDVDVDIYEYLAKLFFQKKEVDETDIANAKQLTFRQLYGGVEEKYAHIKYLANLKTFINEQWELFQQHGYIETPLFKRKITSHHIHDPNPAKLFNYILQAVEGEIAIPKLKSVQEYLQGKKTKAILYTYDAVLYDFHKEDGLKTLNDIRRIMSFDGAFPMKTYIGETYQDVKLVSL
jgi:hypothetical protein